MLFALVFLPLTVSIIVKTFGLTIMMRRDGIMNWLLVTLGFIERPIRLVFTEFSLDVGMVNVFLPFMILPIYSVDAHARSAPHRCGGEPRRRPGPHLPARVTLPLTMPGIVAGASIVFSIAVAAYVTPGLLIGDRYMTMSQVMAKAYLNIRDFQLGASMAGIMLVIATVIVFASSYLARSAEQRVADHGALRHGLLLGHARAGADVSVRADPDRRRRSRSPPRAMFSFPPQGFSLRWYYAIRNADSSARLGLAFGADRVPRDLHLAGARHAVRDRDRARTDSRRARRSRPSWCRR